MSELLKMLIDLESKWPLKVDKYYPSLKFSVYLTSTSHKEASVVDSESRDLGLKYVPFRIKLLMTSVKNKIGKKHHLLQKVVYSLKCMNYKKTP